MTKGTGRIVKDAFGNMLILPVKTGDQDFEIHYRLFWYDRAAPIIGGVLIFLLLINYKKLYPKIKNKLPSLRSGLASNEEEY